MERSETTRLLRRARGGSRDALEVLYERFAGRLLSVVRLRMGRQLRARLDSVDVLQACLLRSFERIEQFEGEDGTTFMAWLARIAENEIRDLADFHKRERRDLRKSAPFPEDEALAARSRSVLSRLILRQNVLRLESALESLPEGQREVILLRKLEERSWAEVAGRLGKSEDACRMQLARAMTALTRAVEEA